MIIMLFNMQNCIGPYHEAYDIVTFMIVAWSLHIQIIEKSHLEIM